MFGNNNDCPKQGDLIWIDAEPHAGHEYGGHARDINNIRRPMLVVSSDIYNERTGMVVGFPITSKVPREFTVSMKISTKKINGYAIFSNLLGYDYSARHGQVIDHLNKALRMQALAAVKDIFGIY
ncbi:type II toxin-antitoxin system PemK/MazF family toxin [Lactobacillus sp. ESL0684]|uniref:type II toxin-antitoxin system PemK/MazF family toxin n=1 Tax=Lactobacillus sp. ESL0684 TaxID=2983213 RepID=UPI0023F62F21|nr:type II toxin-antitoxin system PemK/MazF family toxin [Lactobacillus sp. ESL0684]WEV43824.1 type II toxin-antitoxin system PemK/MazF family toxin [Lactobacillus sp. ESL0684]